MSPSFSSPPVVVGLDIGTTKICALVAGDGEGTSPDGTGGEPPLQILGVGIVPSQGVRRGVVVDVPDTEAAIKEAVARAAHMAGVEIEGAVAGVTGDHIVSQNRIGSVTVASRGNQISAFDVDRVLSAALLEIGRDREIIHSAPRSFAVDEQRGIKTPLGMVGTRLEVETHVVTGQSSTLRNTLSCLNGAGVRVDGLVLEPLASAEAVTTRAERELGVLVLDIGGGTTDLAAYFDGAVIYSAALPVGGNHVTRDLSIGLSTPFEFAEKLKVGSGAATRDMIPHGEALEVLPAGGASKLRIPRALLGEIIEARMRELFEISLSMAMNGGLQGMVPAGVVLSGGGALLPGSVELAGRIFGLPVRLGVPEGLSGWSESVSSPQFSTAVGLCRFALAQKRVSRQKAASAIALPQARRVWGQIIPNISMVRSLAPPTAPMPSRAPAPAPVAAPPAREEFPAQMSFSSTAPQPSVAAKLPPVSQKPPANEVVVPPPTPAAPTPSAPSVVAPPMTVASASDSSPTLVPASPTLSPTYTSPAPSPKGETPPAKIEAPTAKESQATQEAVSRAPSPDLVARIEAMRKEVALSNETTPTKEASPSKDGLTTKETPSSGGSPSPTPEAEQTASVEEKPSFWSRFVRFIGFGEE